MAPAGAATMSVAATAAATARRIMRARLAIPLGPKPSSRRGAGVVERGGLENRCALFGAPRVRIPPPPLIPELWPICSRPRTELRRAVAAARIATTAGSHAGDHGVDLLDGERHRLVTGPRHSTVKRPLDAVLARRADTTGRLMVP